MFLEIDVGNHVEVMNTETITRIVPSGKNEEKTKVMFTSGKDATIDRPFAEILPILRETLVWGPTI